MAFLGETLKHMRISKKQSLQQVADSVGASKAHIWDLETGRSRNPSADLLERLAQHFGTTVSRLVGESPDADEPEEVLAMFREFKELSPENRDRLRKIMEALKDAPEKHRK
jgi:transcriptional regulator with XRE-family HTH domain